MSSLAQRELLERGVRRAAVVWASQFTERFAAAYQATGSTAAQAEQRALTLVDEVALIMARTFIEAADRDAGPLARIEMLEPEDVAAKMLTRASAVLKQWSNPL